MKRRTIIGLAVTAMFAMTAVAVAQYALPVVQVTGNVTPNKGGSKKKPKNAKASVGLTVNAESRKTVSTITLYTPRRVKLSGAGFRYCTASKIALDGDASCPRKSRVGTGEASAVVGPDFSPLTFDVDVFAASKNELALSMKQSNGAKTIAVAIEAPITDAGKPFGQKITVNIPTTLQQPAPGAYAYITGVKATIGAKYRKVVKKATKKHKAKKRTYRFASLTGCPKKGTHDFGVELTFAQNDVGPGGTSDLARGADECRK